MASARQFHEARFLSVSLELLATEAHLEIPAGAGGIIIFPHDRHGGSRSLFDARLSRALLRSGFAILLFDVLAPFDAIPIDAGALEGPDIGLAAERLVEAADWVAGHPETQDMGIGYFGADAAGGAALVAAAERPDAVQAVVCKSARTDLSGPTLPRIQAPTLLIVGETDRQLAGATRSALSRFRAETRLEIIPRSDRDFRKPGALEQVSHHACEWFHRYVQAEGGGRDHT